MALLGLLAARNLLLDLLVVLYAFLLGGDEVAACAHSVHEVRLEEVVEGVQVKALVEQLQIHLLCQAHQTHGLVLHLGHESLVGLALRGNQLCDEVLTVRLGDGLRLRVEDIGEVVVILLLGEPDFDEGEYVEAG